MFSDDRSGLSIRPWSVFLLLLTIVGFYYFLPQLSELQNIVSTVQRINWWLIIAGVIAMTSGFVLTTYIQYIAGARRGSLRDLLILELRGSFINHFLPFSIGTITLATRYYTHFVTKTKAMIIATLPTISSTIVSVMLLAIVSPIALSHIPTQLGIRPTTWLVSSLLSAALAGFCVALLFWRKVKHFIDRTISVLSDTADTRRFGVVSLYTALQISIYSIVLWLSALSAHASISYFDALALYIVVWAVGNIAPTPGGIGAIEATLTLGVVSLRTSLPQAVVTMLVFRLISFWIPLIPGAFAMWRKKRFSYGNEQTPDAYR